MADTKFHCPECKQKIAVHEEAAGEKIDCPRCCSTIVIPTTSGGPVKVEVRRQLAVLAGVQTDLYFIIEEQQKKVRAVEAESVKIRAEAQRAQADIRMMREELGALQHQREALAVRLTNAEAAREAASAAQIHMAELRQEVATLRAARDGAAARANKAEELNQVIRERLVNDERERSDAKAQSDAALAERDAARRDLQGAQKAVEELRDRIKEREAAYIKASLAAEGARHELEQLRNAPPPPPVKDEELEKKYNQAQARLQGREKQIEAAKAALLTAAADRDAAQKRAAELQSSLAETAGKAAASQIDKTRVENALSTVSKAYEKSRRELAALQQRLADLEFGAVATAAEPGPTAADISETEQRLFLMREEINLLHDKLTRTEESARNSKALIEETERHLNDSQAKCRALAAERDRLAAALGQVANGGIETAESRLLGSDRDHSQAAIAALEARLRRSAEYLRQVEAERDELKTDLAAARKAVQRSGDEGSRVTV